MDGIDDIVIRVRQHAPPGPGFFARALGRLALGTTLIVGVFAMGAVQGAVIIEPLARAARVMP